MLSSNRHTSLCVSGFKKCSCFGKFGVFCLLVTPVMRFALLLYYRRVDGWKPVDGCVLIVPLLYDLGVADQFGRLRLQLISSWIAILRSIRYYFRKLLIMFRVRKPMSNDTVWGTITLFLVFLFYLHSMNVVKNKVILTDVCVLNWKLYVWALTDITSSCLVLIYFTNRVLQSTSTISNARYLELSLFWTFSLVPSAFLVTFLIITFGISNFHYVEQIFRSLQLYYPAISNFFISTFDF